MLPRIGLIQVLDATETMLIWKIFWLVVTLVVLPLPFKIFEYATGRDGSPTIVKVEEMLNAGFFCIGLIGLYGFAYKQPGLGVAAFWEGWIVLAVVISVAGLLWSPKLQYGMGVLGSARARVILALGTAFLLPMLAGVALYSAST